MEQQDPRPRSLSDVAYEKILANIVGGEFQTGDKLPAEEALAERLGVSRPIVREALARLREEGLIVSRRGSGSYVAAQRATTIRAFAPLSSISDMRQCFEFRVELEGIAAYYAALRRTDEDIAEIERALFSWNAVVERGIGGVQENFELHARICRASHNRFFVESLDLMGENIGISMNLARKLSNHRPQMTVVAAEHAEIVAAIVAGDGDRAQQAMRRHIDNGRFRVFEGADRPEAGVP